MEVSVLVRSTRFPRIKLEVIGLLMLIIPNEYVCNCQYVCMLVCLYVSMFVKLCTLIVYIFVLPNDTLLKYILSLLWLPLLLPNGYRYLLYNVLCL